MDFKVTIVDRSAGSCMSCRGPDYGATRTTPVYSFKIGIFFIARFCKPCLEKLLERLQEKMNE